MSARGARRFLRAFAGDHGLSDEVTDPAELALSEVVTNVVLHAHTSFEVVLVLDDDRAALRVEVTDHDPQLPVQRHYADQATTGRGMELVAAVTEDCGVDARGAAGKTVWFVVPVIADEDTDGGELADWHIDLEQAAESAGGRASVVLLGLPPRLWLAARQHHDALVRELTLYAAEHAFDTPPPERIAQADRARAWISAHLVAELDRLAGSRGDTTGWSGVPADGPSSLDLVVAIPPDAAAAFAALQDVLDAGERLAAAGLLLAYPALPEIVAVRDWACEQAIAQLAGVAASPWPGTVLDRSPVEVRWAAAAAPEWDAGVVRDAARGAVAADDANRILAVSQSLAAALGWQVEDLVGQRVVVLVPPELRDAHVAGFTRHLTTGDTQILGVPLRLPVLRADGSRMTCEVLIEQVPAPPGRRVYVAWIAPLDRP